MLNLSKPLVTEDGQTVTLCGGFDSHWITPHCFAARIGNKQVWRWYDRATGRDHNDPSQPGVISRQEYWRRQFAKQDAFSAPYGARSPEPRLYTPVQAPAAADARDIRAILDDLGRGLETCVIALARLSKLT